MYCIYELQYCTLGGYWKIYISKQEICITFMYCSTVLLEAIENFILANKRYVLHLCTAILSSWRLLKYYGGHHLPNNNVNTVTLFLMYRVIRISCFLRAILASSVAPLRSSANIALNKQEIRITWYIRKRVTVLTLLLGKWWPPQYFSSLQDDSIAVHKCNTYRLSHRSCP